MIWDEPTNWNHGVPTELDPFTTIWRGSFKRRKTTSAPGIFHLDPNCPLLSIGSPRRGRLGSVLAHGWVLCSREDNPLAWNLPTTQAEIRQAGRVRALAALAAMQEAT